MPTYVFGISHTNGTCIYSVRLNWEETGSAKSKIAAYTHESVYLYISPPRLASIAILTAIPMFSGQPYQWDIYLYCTTKL